MRKYVERISGGGGRFTRLLHAFLATSLVALASLASNGLSQSVTPQSTTSPQRSQYFLPNQLAGQVQLGDPDAARGLAREVFKNAGIPSDAADAFGFTDRIAQAEIAYRQGRHPAVHEQDIVNAVNNLASTLGTPAWTHTTQPEVRRLRVRLFATLPKLFANNEPPDAKGHYSLLSPKMSPIEASYVATTMLYMKVFYGDFQFTDAERAQNRTLNPAIVAAAQKEREGQMLDIVQGRSNTVSVIDLLAAGDHLYADLGIPALQTSQLQKTNAAVTAAKAAKGGL